MRVMSPANLAAVADTVARRVCAGIDSAVALSRRRWATTYAGDGYRSADVGIACQSNCPCPLSFLRNQSSRQKRLNGRATNLSGMSLLDAWGAAGFIIA